MRSGLRALSAAFLWFAFPLLPLAGVSGQVRWDGSRDNSWDDPGNWVGDTVPGEESSVLFDDSAGFAGDGPLMVFAGNSMAADVTVDVPEWALRPRYHMDGLEIFGGGILFTERFAGGGSFKTFAGAGNMRALRVRFHRGASIVNNSDGTVFFGSSDSVDGFGISSLAVTDVDVRLGGTGAGGFLWESGSVFKGVGSFGTAEDFAAVFEIRGGYFEMAGDLVAEGGTIRIAADDVIDDSVALTLASNRRVDAAVIDISGVRGTVGALQAFAQGGTLRVDAATHYTFSSYNGGPVNVEGFVTGETVVRFSEPIAEAELANLLVNGEPIAAINRIPRAAADEEELNDGR